MNYGKLNLKSNFFYYVIPNERSNALWWRIKEMIIMNANKKVMEEHNCIEHGVYLEPCDDCRRKGEAKHCVLLINGICSICGDIIK